MAMGLMPGEDDWMTRLRMAGMGGIFGGPSDPAPPTAPAVPTSLMGKLNQATQPFGGPMQLGLAMLANSGPSATKRGFGEILGTSALQAQQGQQQQQENTLRRQYMQAQISQLTRKDNSPLPVPKGTVLFDPTTRQPIYSNDSADKTTGQKDYEYAKGQGFKGSFQDWQSKSNSLPATLQEWAFYNNLSPHDQERFVNMKRSQNPYVQTEVAGAPGAFSKQTGTFAPLASTQQEAQGQATIAGAKAGAAETGTKTADALFDLPRLEQNTQQAIDTLDNLAKSPGLKYITGAYSYAPVIPGTPQAKADALAQQVEGQTFLQAYNTLRGGGQITEVEGKKATSAIGRLQRAQNTSDYQSALNDLKEVLTNGLNRARQQANVTKQYGQGVQGPNGMTLYPNAPRAGAAQTPDAATRAQGYY